MNIKSTRKPQMSNERVSETYGNIIQVAKQPHFYTPIVTNYFSISKLDT